MGIRTASPGSMEQGRMVTALKQEFPSADLTDKKEFDDAWFNYFSKNEGFAVSTGIRDEAYKIHVFSKASGKDIKRDRDVTSKRQVDTIDKFIEKGSKNVDMVGIDTRSDRFNLTGKLQGKRVKARETTFRIKKRTITRLRDSKGRFLSRS